MTHFTLTAEHVTLLRNTSVSWNDLEVGAPTIDPKRPYGNGDHITDICRILGWPKEGDNGHEPCWSSTQRKRARVLHGDLETALQVVLAAGSFEPGLYGCTDYMRNWRRLDRP